MILEPDNGNELDRGNAYQTSDFPATSLQRIDDVCLRFESHWRNVAQADAPKEAEPVLGQWLNGFEGKLRDALFAELLALDIEYRIQTGQTPDAAYYETRFPNQSTVIESVFRENQSGNQSDHGDYDALANSDCLPPISELSLTSQFQLRQFHARGGVGVIYVAYDESLRRNVAIKFSRKRLGRTSAQSRLAREAEITGRLEHPGIVPVYATGVQPDGSPCYVMQFVEGETLRTAIRAFHESSNDADRFSTLQFRQLLQRLIAVCNTVAYAHDQQVIHRDIKPSNIMLGKFGETFLLDWGLAKSMTDSDTPVELDHKTESPGFDSGVIPFHQTVIGQQIGTPAFASPEQVAGKVDEHDTCSDVFSLGATLYCLLTGKGPLDPGNMQSSDASHNDPTIANPRSVNKNIPRELAAVCTKALQRLPNDRYSSATTLAEDLERYLADEPIAIMKETTTSRVRRWIRKNPWKVIAVASSLLIALVSFGAASWLIGNKNTELTETNRSLIESQESERVARSSTHAALRSLTDNTIERWMASNQEMTDSDRQYLNSILEQYQTFADSNPDLESAVETKAEGFLRVAQLQKILGEREQAISTCQIGLAFFESRTDAATDTVLEIKSQIQTIAGLMLSESGDWIQANKLLENSVTTVENLLSHSPDSSAFMSSYSQSLDGLGVFHVRRRQYQKAANRFKESLAVIDRIPKTDYQRFNLNLRRTQSSHNLAVALLNTNQFADAKKVLNNALQMRQQVSSSSSDAMVQIFECRMLITLANIHSRLNEDEEVSRHLDQALSKANLLANDYPRMLQPYRLLTDVHFQRSGLLRRNGELDQAIHSCDMALKSSERLLQRSPNDIEALQKLIDTHGLQASFFRALKDKTKASDHYQRAIKLSEQLHELDPSAFRETLLKSLLTAGDFFLRIENYQDAESLARHAIKLVDEFSKPEQRAQIFQFEVGSHQLIAYSLMKTNRKVEASEHWQVMIDKTERQPIIMPNGEDMNLTARVYHAFCLATFEPQQAMKEIGEIVDRPTLVPMQIYNLSCAAASASKNLENDDDSERAVTVALQLLEHATRINYFKTPANFAKQVRDNPTFNQLVDNEEFLRIEKAVNESFDR